MFKILVTVSKIVESSWFARTIRGKRGFQNAIGYWWHSSNAIYNKIENSIHTWVRILFSLLFNLSKIKLILNPPKISSY